MAKPTLIAGLVSALIAVIQVEAADLSTKAIEKSAPPRELDESIRKLLQERSVQIVDGTKAVYEFWFVREVPITAKPASSAKALETLKQTTLLGAVFVSKNARDYRDDDLAAAIYTLRFSLQPQDGNHLGTAEFPYFAVLIPAKIDTKPDGIKDYKAMVKASSKETSTDHPVIFSLFPKSVSDAPATKLNQPAMEHKSFSVRIPAKLAGSEEKAEIAFELVVEGKGKK